LKLLARNAAADFRCTILAYDGPGQPDSAVATITSERTMIAAIDGKPVPYSGGNFATFKVLPGVHTLIVKLNDVPVLVGHRLISEKDLPMVFSAVAGRAYVVRPVYVGKMWTPEIVEKPATDGVSDRK